MSNETLDDRRKALEDQFFKQQNDQLVAKMRAAQAQKATKADITRFTGITNDEVLTSLANLNIGGAAVLVMSVYPLVEVAWADGSVDGKERKAVLDQSRHMGVADGSEASQFLTQLLDEKPDLSWHHLWVDFVKALCGQMKPEERVLLKNEVLGRARTVAEASGGVMGIGWRVSGAEQKVLETLELAFG